MRFLLGNLYDFVPDKDSVPFQDIKDPFDLYALDCLYAFINSSLASYESYAFHDVYHGIITFLGSLSSFYLDVLKDRLYTLKSSDPKRRASQTVMLEVLRSVTLLFAPILSFTAEEIWSHLPGKEKEPESVFLSEIPLPPKSFENPELRQKMERLLQARGKVNKALEEERAKKTLGSSLDAEARLYASKDLHGFLMGYESLLPELFIVSRVVLFEDPDLTEENPLRVEILRSPLHKCPRCWNRRPEVPEDGSRVCDKCAEALK
jgi:isoleucyl-tRNA synthetase